MLENYESPGSFIINGESVTNTEINPLIKDTCSEKVIGRCHEADNFYVSECKRTCAKYQEAMIMIVENSKGLGKIIKFAPIKKELTKDDMDREIPA